MEKFPYWVVSQGLQCYAEKLSISPTFFSGLIPGHVLILEFLFDHLSDPDRKFAGGSFLEFCRNDVSQKTRGENVTMWKLST